MIRLTFFSVILLFPIADLLMSYLYNITASPSVVLIRYYRDIVCVALAGLGFLSRHLPYHIRLSCLGYGAILVIYMLTNFISSKVDVAVVVISIGTLIIPFSLTLAGFTAIRTERDMNLLIRILILYGIATALFGMWDVHHTEFWTDTIDIGRYNWDVKDVTTGYQPLVFLPWNFTGFDDERRAAGLLAAPLAQGFFLAVIGIVAFGVIRARSTTAAFLISILCFYGIYMSSTRGAMIAYILGSIFYFAYPWQKRDYSKNLIILIAIATIGASLIYRQVIATIELTDGSTVGHIEALKKNIESITSVFFVGSGLGTAGGQASSVGLEIEGGGEGAIFSIAYQMGVPSALMFLWYYCALFLTVFSQRNTPGRTGELSRCLCGLFLGVALSMVTSEHILTFSGMGAFWFAVGGFIGYTRRVEVDNTASTPPAQPTASTSTSLTVV